MTETGTRQASLLRSNNIILDQRRETGGTSFLLPANGVAIHKSMSSDGTAIINRIYLHSLVGRVTVDCGTGSIKFHEPTSCASGRVGSRTGYFSDRKQSLEHQGLSGVSKEKNISKEG